MKSISTETQLPLAKIIIRMPGEPPYEEILSAQNITIGRDQTNTICLMSPIISKNHALIKETPEGHTITDLKSMNGTYVNGKRIKSKEPHPLAQHDIIRFSDPLANSGTLVYMPLSASEKLAYMTISEALEVKEVALYIGRDPDNNIHLDHPIVSLNHAKVFKDDENHYVIQDLGSENGTYIDGVELVDFYILVKKDIVSIGPFKLIYQGEGKFISFSAERNFRLEAVNLEKIYYGRNFIGIENKSKPRRVLRDANLTVYPREFVAIVGGSGTGKSTLLKTLNGSNQATNGTVLVNGDNLYENFDLYRTLIGYVPQNDIVHDSLTVHQVLKYAALLRLPDSKPKEIKERIDNVLEKVSMTTERNKRVRSLSGGQRKRVSIAVELLVEPWLFFLDEPAAGLDPGLEKLMMGTLRQLADEGRTVILVTHATANIIAHCDHVAFLAPGGELAYFGPPADAAEFFDVDNFSDIYTLMAQRYSRDNDTNVPLKIQDEYENLSHVHPALASDGSVLAGPLWAEHFRSSDTYQTYTINRQQGEDDIITRPQGVGKHDTFSALIRQFTVLTQRYFNLIIRDPISLFVLLAVMPVIGIILLMIVDSASLVGNTAEEISQILSVDGVYNIVNEAQTLLFMMALSANLLGVFSGAYEIVKEQAIYHRARLVNLRILPYYASKFVVLAGFALLQCFFLIVVLRLNVDLPRWGIFMPATIEYYTTLVLTALASISSGLLISTMVRSRNPVVYIVLVTLFIQIVFSGAIFRLVPLTEPLSYLTITRWSLEGLGASTDMDKLNNLSQVQIEPEIDFGRGIQRLAPQNVSTPVNFFVNYTHTSSALILRWLGLVVHTIAWSIVAMWLLKRQDRF